MVTKLRPDLSTKELDTLEYEWWDKHAHTVEAVWALPEELRRACRNHYMKRARKFFLAGVKKRPARILEFGCGSGWVGRLIAEPGKLHVIGVDNSNSQIDLAKQAAAAENLSGTCEYVCADLNEWMKDGAATEQVDGVLVHAILHHFSQQEIQHLLKMLGQFKPGTRLFIYEPVFLDKPNRINSSQKAKDIYKYAKGLPWKWQTSVLKDFEKDRDHELTDALNSLLQQAAQNGWVLSPKEVVFREEELDQLLSKYFVIRNRSVCNFHSLFVAQQAALINNRQAWQPIIDWVIPAARVLDELLYKVNLQRLEDEAYIFGGYECVVR
jgi:2-polyprenyl-3-methyl-5-hydroxy-6-metoxy-1,4-benzoquinol methylase